jgi:hypothetical protein
MTCYRLCNHDRLDNNKNKTYDWYGMPLCFLLFLFLLLVGNARDTDISLMEAALQFIL